MWEPAGMCMEHHVISFQWVFSGLDEAFLFIVLVVGRHEWGYVI